MKITNIHGLPAALVRAVENDPYNSRGSDLTCTQLIDSPRIRVLFKKHEPDIEIDVSERLWALAGQAMHLMLERAEQKKIVEERLFADVLGWKLSGQVDVLDDDTIEDWKWTSAWSYVFKSNFKKWEAQLNVLAYLARINGFKPKRLQINAIFRDWQRSQALKSSDYPQIPAITIPFPMWDEGTTAAYVAEHTLRHIEAEKELPLCSDEDRWLNEKTGKFTRCEDYCPVRAFCQQFKEDRRKEKS